MSLLLLRSAPRARRNNGFPPTKDGHGFTSRRVQPTSGAEPYTEPFRLGQPPTQGSGQDSLQLLQPRAFSGSGQPSRWELPAGFRLPPKDSGATIRRHACILCRAATRRSRQWARANSDSGVATHLRLGSAADVNLVQSTTGLGAILAICWAAWVVVSTISSRALRRSP